MIRLVTAPLPYTHTDVLCCCVPLCSLTHRTLRREENSALSLSLSLSLPLPLSLSHSLTHRTLRREQRALSLSLSHSGSGFFPLTFRVSSASGLFFTLVCSTYLLTSRVLVNVGFVQTWCLVECDSRLCLSEIFFFFFKPSAGSNQFFLLHALSV